MIAYREHMLRMNSTALIFDLDGTLIDSVIGAAGALNTSLATIGRPPVHVDAVKRMIGEGGRRTIEQGLQATGGTDGVDIDAVFDRWTQAYIENEVAKTKPYPGVTETLDMLAADGYRLGLCTNKARAVTMPILEAAGLARFFTAVVTPEDTPHRKPDGRHILATVAALGAAPEHAVYIGDSEIDLVAANDASIPMILVSYGYPRGPIENIKADARIDNFHELPAALVNLR